MISVNVLKAYVPEKYKAFLPHNLIFHSISLLCWSPCSACFSILCKRIKPLP